MRQSELRVGCWNLDHWRRSAAARKEAWEWLDGQNLDLMLLQEAAPPAGREAVWRRQGIYRGKRWGSAVVANGLKLDEITEGRAYGAKYAETSIGPSQDAWRSRGRRSRVSS